MLSKIKKYLKGWWKRHIIDDCPPELVEHEFSDKYRR